MPKIGSMDPIIKLEINMYQDTLDTSKDLLVKIFLPSPLETLLQKLLAKSTLLAIIWLLRKDSFHRIPHNINQRILGDLVSLYPILQ
jgi:hypothetical protein